MKSKRGERELEKSNFDTTFICLHELLIENGFFVSRFSEAGGPYVPWECKVLWPNW